MQDKNTEVLITYESKTGSTAEIAGLIANDLLSTGISVDLCSLKDLKDINKYNFIIIGSPIIKGAPLPEIVAFIKNNEKELAQKQISYFLVCLALSRITDKKILCDDIFVDSSFNVVTASSKKMRFTEKDHAMSKYLNPLIETAPSVKPVGSAFLSGKLDYKKLDLASRITMKIMALFIKEIHEGDFINKDAIKLWVEHLSQEMI